MENMNLPYSVCDRRTFLRGSLLAAAGVACGGLPGMSYAAVKKPLMTASGLDFFAKAVKLVRRSEWCVTAVNHARLRRADFFDRITVHHIGSEVYDVARNSVVYLLDNVQHAHRQRRFGDIGYHFAVDGAGTVWECRSLEFEGAHVSGQNERNLGIALLGNFEQQTITDAQSAGLDRLLSAARDFYAVKRHRVYGHLELGSSICPGRNAQGWLEKWRA